MVKITLPIEISNRAFTCFFVSVFLLSSCTPVQQTESIVTVASPDPIEATSTRPPSPSKAIEMEHEMGEGRITEVSKYLPKLQSTSKDPAWIGFIIAEGCGSYFQYTYHDGQFWLEYMLFPEEQLAIEDEFKASVSAHELSFNEVEIGGDDSYLEVPLGPDIDKAYSSSLSVIKSACQVDEEAKVEFLNEL